MTRWTAALIHLAISGAVGLAVAAFLLMVWYPPPYFAAAGAMDLTLLILSVDLVLGPLLTLVVFKQGKPRLALDLFLIGLMQVSALIYGLSVVVASRPVYLVGVVDRFELVSANEVLIEPATSHEFRDTPWLKPKLVAAIVPQDERAKSRLIEESMAGLPDVSARPAFYRPYPERAEEIYNRSLSLAQLADLQPESRGRLERWLKRKDVDLGQARYVPLVLRERDMVMVLDPHTKLPLGPFDMTPAWAGAAHPPASPENPNPSK